MNKTKNLFVTPNEKLLCIKGTEHLFSVCHKTSDFVTETVAENIEEKTAHLFASAPDLLSALQACLDYLLLDSMMEEDAAPEIEKIKNAIAKAKGEA